MNIKNSFQKKHCAVYQDFIHKMKDFRWSEWSEAEISGLLRDCVFDEGRLPEAYGILKELIRRITGLSLFDTQLMAAYSMQQGRIAELPTGEGKTLSAVVTAGIFALQKKHVHILVFNDYLAYRDYSNNLPVYRACGISCGYIVEDSDFAHRKEAYSCDVVYVSAKEAAFDYLRDFLHTEKEKLLLGSLPVALVDEADSILIDEARIPLVLAGNSDIRSQMAGNIIKAVSELPQGAYEVNRADNQVWLTEAGVGIMEAELRIGNLYSPENADTLAMTGAALEARFLLQKDKDYIVKDDGILVIDEATGRVAENRRFPDPLHQAVEMQELGTQDAGAVIYNSMSMQAFLSLYTMLCGMTGTAASSSSEFWQMYDLEVDVIPPHIPCIRIDHPDRIFLEKDEQEKAILACIQGAHDKGQPVLVGTQSVQESEHFSSLLMEYGIEHCVLNARNDTMEAGIIADAGSPYRVTISTNMAGRGVDIRLGGKHGEYADFVRDIGGLLVVSTGINRSLRIDNQLRGRAGRQGDPGESRFFVCLNGLQLETFFGIEFCNYTKYPGLLRRAQRIQESRDAEARYMLERYSEILEIFRQEITCYRTQLLSDLRLPHIMREDEPDVYKELIDRHGKRGVTIAEKQMTLYFINTNWASYLTAMEDKRSGIHLMVIGGKSPLDEYRKFAVSAFNEMMADIRSDVISCMQKCVITENGIDMAAAGLSGATTTWTYMINDSSGQFSRIPYLVKSMSNTIRGTVFTVRGMVREIRRWIRNKSASRKEP